MRIRLTGLATYLVFAAAVYLLLDPPLAGPGAPLLALVLLVGFPFAARAVVLRDLERRCVWSGQEIAPGCAYRVRTRSGVIAFHAYNEPMRAAAARFLTALDRLRVPLFLLVVAAPAAAGVLLAAAESGLAGVPSADTVRDALRAALALSALLAALGTLWVRPVPHHAKEPVRLGLPVGYFALLGIRFSLLVALVAAAVFILRLVAGGPG